MLMALQYWWLTELEHNSAIARKATLNNYLETITKEVHYFYWNYDRGKNWYRSWFPLKSARSDGVVIAGEASPAYLMDPHVPDRVAKTMPKARIIVLLRDPVERAHSHYQLRKSQGVESAESFAEALADEPRRQQCPQRLIRLPFD